MVGHIKIYLFHFEFFKMAASIRKFRPCQVLFQRYLRSIQLSANFSAEGFETKSDTQDIGDKETHFGFQTVRESEKEGKGLYYRPYITCVRDCIMILH